MTIDDISEGIFEVSVKEDTFNCEILENIVDMILGHYDECDWILLGLGSIKNHDLEDDKINNLMEYYKMKSNISFNYVD